MSSSKGAVPGKKGGVVVILPTVEEVHSTEGEAFNSRSSSPGDENGLQAGGSTYPVDLLGVSWGSYLHSTPPSRSDVLEEKEENSPRNGAGILKGRPGLVCSQAAARKTGATANAATPNEPHPFLQQLCELMEEIVSSKEDLVCCGVDASSLSSVSNLSLESQYSVLQMTMKENPNTNQILNDSSLMVDAIKYLREVLKQLIEQGRRTAKQTHFLQATARKLNDNHQKTLNEQKSIQEVIREDRAKVEAERQELEKEKAVLLETKVELGRMLQEAEVRLKERERATRKMDSPHTVAQEQSQRIELSKTQRQQSHLEKTFTKQLRDLRSLQLAHDQTRSELLAAKEQAMKLQHRIAKQVHDIKSSEAAMSRRFEAARGVQMSPSLSLEREKKRKTYQGISEAQISSTLQNITTAHRNLCRDIERMQKKLSQQQTAGIRVSRQMDDSHRELLETNSLVRRQSKTLKRGHTDQPHVYPESDKLPKLYTESSNIQKRRITKDFSLPHIEPYQDTISVPKQVTAKKPAYQFSKDELHKLAKFQDHKSAKDVTEWLQTQGKLEE